MFVVRNVRKMFAASFNGKPNGNGYAFGSPLNDMFQTFTSTTSQKYCDVPVRYR
jgi:hypothetical protein